MIRPCLWSQDEESGGYAIGEPFWNVRTVHVVAILPFSYVMENWSWLRHALPCSPTWGLLRALVQNWNGTISSWWWHSLSLKCHFTIHQSALDPSAPFSSWSWDWGLLQGWAGLSRKLNRFSLLAPGKDCCVVVGLQHSQAHFSLCFHPFLNHFGPAEQNKFTLCQPDLYIWLY